MDEELIIPVEQLKAIIVGIHDAETPGFVAVDAKGTMILRKAFKRLDERKQTPEKKQRQPRSPNIELTKEIAEKVRKLAQKYPNMNKEDLSLKAGLKRKTISNRKDEFWIEDWGVSKTLTQIVDIARLEAYKHSDETWTAADVAEMGISNRYKRNDN